MSIKPMGKIKFLHILLTDLMTDCMFIMWFGMVLDNILVVYALITGVDMIVYPDRASTLRILSRYLAQAMKRLRLDLERG